MILLRLWASSLVVVGLWVAFSVIHMVIVDNPFHKIASRFFKYGLCYLILNLVSAAAYSLLLALWKGV